MIAGIQSTRFRWFSVAVDTGRSAFPPMLRSLMPAAASAWRLRRATSAPRSVGGGSILARSPTLPQATRGRSTATQHGPRLSVWGVTDRQSVTLGYLWSDETGLPADSYSEEDIASMAEGVFRHGYRSYPTVPSPLYAQAS